MDKINFAKEDPSLLGEEKNELFYLRRYATRSSAAQIGRPGYTRPSSEAEFGLEIRCAPPPWVPRTRTRRGFLDRTHPGGWLAASLPI